MTEQEIELEDLRADLTQANSKLFEAGKFAGQQEALITLLLAALEGIVEHGTDSPEHRRAEQAIAIARVSRALAREDTP